MSEEDGIVISEPTERAKEIAKRTLEKVMLLAQKEEGEIEKELTEMGKELDAEKSVGLLHISQAANVLAKKHPDNPKYKEISDIVASILSK